MLSRRDMILGMLAVPAAVAAQQLAHPGWRGNSIAPEAWWRHAAFVRFPGDATFAGITGMLDHVAAANVDSLLLPDLQPTVNAPFAARFGAEDDLDTLLRETSARRMHLLIRMPLSRSIANMGEVRFWMNRGVAGMDVGSAASGDGDDLRTLRAALDHFPGNRILMARTPGGVDKAVARSRFAPADPVTLHVLSAKDALDGVDGGSLSMTRAVEVEGSPAPDAPRGSKTLLPNDVPGLGAFLPLLLCPDAAPILDSGILTAQGAALARVLAFRSTHTELRAAAAVAVPGDHLRAWVLRSREPMLIAWNKGADATPLRLREALASAGMRGDYIYPLLRSDGAMGSVSMESGMLPAGAVIVGELRSSGYASPTPRPQAARSGSRRRRRQR